MEEVGRGLRTFAKPHQCVLASAGKGAEHVLLRSTTRPVSLDTTNTSSLPSLSCLLSLSVRAPRCPPLARARPQGTRTSCTRRRSRVFWRWGFSWVCCSCGRWVAYRPSAPAACISQICVDVGPRLRVSIDTVHPSNLPSLDRHVQTAPLSLRSAHPQAEPPPPPPPPPRIWPYRPSTPAACSSSELTRNPTGK